MVDPEYITDADNDRRMLQHGCKDREREHLFITDQHCGALVIDLSGHSASVGEAVPWFRGFDSLHGQLSAADTQSKLVSIPSASAEAIVRMAFGLSDLRLRTLTATVLRPAAPP